MKAIYRKRLERLAQLLENWSVEKKLLVAPPKGKPVTEFDLGKWKCGTAACALGSAALLPEFNEAGLILDSTEVPAYNEETAEDAGAEFFGLSGRQAEYLFTPWTYPRGSYTTPKTVAKRVREILEGKA